MPNVTQSLSLNLFNQVTTLFFCIFSMYNVKNIDKCAKVRVKWECYFF